MSEEPIWTVERLHRGSGDIVLVTFRGNVTEESGLASAAEALALMGDDTIHLAFDVVAVGGYQSAARTGWQRLFSKRRSQILSLSIASSSALTRMGGNLFASLLGVPHRIVKRRSQLLE